MGELLGSLLALAFLLCALLPVLAAGAISASPSRNPSLAFHKILLLLLKWQQVKVALHNYFSVLWSFGTLAHGSHPCAELLWDLPGRQLWGRPSGASDAAWLLSYPWAEMARPFWLPDVSHEGLPPG